MIHTRLGRLVRQRLVNDIAALVLAGLAMAVLGTVLISVLFWSGWLLLVVTIPLAWLVARWFGGVGSSKEDERHRRAGYFLRTAYDVEEAFLQINGRLVAAMELAQYRPDSREGYSLDLLEAAVYQVESSLGPLPLSRLVRRNRLVLSGAGLVATVLLFLAFRAAFPATAQVGLANAFARTTVPIEFSVLPGDTTVLPGGSVALRCRVKPAGLFRKVWFDRLGRQSDSRRLNLANDTCLVVLQGGDGFRYRFRVLAASSEQARVRVLQPLGLEQLVFTLRSPQYSGIKEMRSSSPDISALKGTVVEVDGEANRFVNQGRIVLGGDTAALAVDRKDSTRFTGRFTVAADADGAIELADAEEGQPVLLPAARLRVRALADEPPLVKLFIPGRDVDMPMSMQVMLGVNSIDDFGLGELWLHYGTDSIDKRLRLGTLRGRREDTTLHTWDLSELEMLPGDAMRYCVAVTDNDVVSGPKKSRSEVYSVRLPTMTEMFSAVVEQTERTENRLGPMQSEQAQLGVELKRVSEELKRSRELSWEEKQALEQVLANQGELLQQVSDLKQEVSQLMQDMEQGMMLDQETMERMGQLQALLSELLPRELQESLAELRNKLQQSSPDVRRALDKFEIDQERLKQGIERALELLKKIAEEQRLEELARKADELAKTQQQLAEKLKEQPVERSAQLEQEIAQALDSLKEAMQALGDSMSDQEIGDSLGNLAQAMDQQGLSRQAERLSGQMKQGAAQKGEAGELGEQMEQLANRLESLSERLKSKRTDQTVRKLASSASDLLLISEEQERLDSAVAGMKELPPAAENEMGLHDATRIVAESLTAFASQSMAVNPGLGRELARAMNDMESAAQALVENRGGGARSRMSAATAGLNQTVLALLQTMASAQQQPGMSGGMQDLMEQLSKLASGQMGINSEMGGFPIPIPGGLTQAQMEALSRILARQRALRQQLQQMLQQMGGTQPGLTSSLEGVLDEMRAVERDLAELNVSRELIERQESVLSHLLDAQRSIRQRGFKEERQSESGKEFELPERPRLPEDLGERNRMLREELIRALKAGYPPEYEKMIRDYFERLLNEP